MMAEIFVTSTADSGAGSLRQAIADANDGDVILFDPLVFPFESQTTIFLTSYLVLNKAVSIIGGEKSGTGYSSGATSDRYVYRVVNNEKTKVSITSSDDIQEGEAVFFEVLPRIVIDGQGSSRIINASANATFIGIGLKNGAASIGGGVYTSSACTLRFNACGFKSCASTSNGGAVYTTSTSVAFFDACSFVSCSASGNGGAILTNNSSAAGFTLCSFDSCTATNGGALNSYLTSGINLIASVFHACSASSNGGVIYSQSTSANTFENTEFIECSASSGGVCYSNNGSSNAFTFCDFKDCTATNGDASYSTSTSSNSFTSCIVSGSIQVASTSTASFDGSELDALIVGSTAAVTIAGKITKVATATLNASTITIEDEAALSLTGTASIGAATIASAGRGYLATATGIDTTSATKTNVVECTYGAEIQTFNVSKTGATWTATNLATPILLEVKSGSTWTTLDAAASGGSYSTTFSTGTIARAFDGDQFFTDSIEAYWRVKSYVYSTSGGGSEGSDDATWIVDNKTITPNLE